MPYFEQDPHTYTHHRYYKTCNDCGANLDFIENCDCHAMVEKDLAPVCSLCGSYLNTDGPCDCGSNEKIDVDASKIRVYCGQNYES